MKIEKYYLNYTEYTRIFIEPEDKLHAIAYIDVWEDDEGLQKDISYVLKASNADRLDALNSLRGCFAQYPGSVLDFIANKEREANK